MKKLLIDKFLNKIDHADIEAVAGYLHEQTAQRIDIVNWKEYPYCPEVFFRMMYDDSAFYLRFDVSEKSVRARATENNAPVWLDSCVEFFLSPEGNDEYYNLEMNCIGAKLLKFKKPGAEPEFASDEVISTICCRSSLGSIPFEERKCECQWNLVAIIPFSTYWKHKIKPVAGLQMRANFYKCGDELSEPHFVSWNRIEVASPNFHQPRFFGELEFR